MPSSHLLGHCTKRLSSLHCDGNTVTRRASGNVFFFFFFFFVCLPYTYFLNVISEISFELYPGHGDFLLSRAWTNSLGYNV